MFIQGGQDLYSVTFERLMVGRVLNAASLSVNEERSFEELGALEKQRTGFTLGYYQNQALFIAGGLIESKRFIRKSKIKAT
mmetsp:Transcript_16081/g.21805  ORF Transcript_16081/g.21805 Transcript_16081/m.21805 type:complete len:81 (+) Transcript_16081:99-341(+)